MAYPDPPPAPPGPPNRMALIGRLLLGALVGFAVFGLLSWHGRRTASPMASVLADPQMGPPYRVFQAEFPQDFEQFRQQMDQAAASGVGRHEAAQAGFASMRAWTGAHRPYLARTSDAAAATLIADQTAVLKHLATTDPAECAHFGVEGAMAEPHTADHELVGLAATDFRDSLLAIKAGMTATATPAPMTHDDGAALIAAMRAQGADDGLLQLIASGGLPTAPPDVQCRGSLLVGEATATLDPARRGRIARKLLTG